MRFMSFIRTLTIVFQAESWTVMTKATPSVYFSRRFLTLSWSFRLSCIGSLLPPPIPPCSASSSPDIAVAAAAAAATAGAAAAAGAA